MDATEAREKARSILTAEGIDRRLITFFLAVQHYPSWITHAGFETKWNFGVTAIRSMPERMEIQYKEKDVSMVVGVFEGQNFKIGGDSYFVDYPDGGCTGYQRIRFGFGKDLNTVVEAEFKMADDPVLPSDYRLSSVEEFHRSVDWISFLDSACRAIDEHKQRQDQIRLRERNKKYEGKLDL